MKVQCTRPGDSFNAVNQGNATYSYRAESLLKPNHEKAPRGLVSLESLGIRDLNLAAFPRYSLFSAGINSGVAA